MANQGIKKIFATALNHVGTTDKEGLGVIRWEGEKCYKYVRYSNEAAAVAGVAGEVCYYVSATGYAISDVTSDLTASDEVGAGVLQAIMADNEYGWVQIKGPATLTLALSTETDGTPLTPAGSGDSTLEISAAVTDNVCAFAGDASAKEILCDFPF